MHQLTIPLYSGRYNKLVYFQTVIMNQKVAICTRTSTVFIDADVRVYLSLILDICIHVGV